jgi:large subunit ribosomal protein L24
MMKTIQPRKQRKKIYQDPLHKRYKRFSSPLSSELKATHNTGSVQVRTGDTVRVYRGEHKGLEGKVTKVDTKNYRIFVEGVTREKIDGTPTPIPMHPSKTMITRLNLDDRWRREALKRKSADKEEEKRKKEKQKTIE